MGSGPGRYRSSVFERFTDQARQMMLTAQEEARLLQHDYVGTEHLLIAATEVDDGLPAALAPLGLTTEALRGIVTRMVAPGGEDRPGELPFTAEATAALERSLREALQLGHGAIRPAHVVLGLLDVHDGTMPVLLTRLGVRADVVRAAVRASLDTDAGAVVPLTAAALCPRCDAPVAENLRLARLSVDGQTVRVAYCGVCGAVVPVTFGA
jgi:ATP-dependent Clp protease ATP-binding subunit ClpA